MFLLLFCYHNILSFFLPLNSFAVVLYPRLSNTCFKATRGEAIKKKKKSGPASSPLKLLKFSFQQEKKTFKAPKCTEGHHQNVSKHILI